MTLPTTLSEILLTIGVIAVLWALYWFMDFDDEPKVPRDLWHGDRTEK